MRLSARVEQLETERIQLEDFTAMAAHELLKPLVINEAYIGMISERMGDALDRDSHEAFDAMLLLSARVRTLVECGQTLQERRR